MEKIISRIFEQGTEILALARRRRNWGFIGEFTLYSADLPSAECWVEDDWLRLRAACEGRFTDAGEPGIIILLFPENDVVRVSVNRTNEND